MQKKKIKTLTTTNYEILYTFSVYYTFSLANSGHKI